MGKDRSGTNNSMKTTAKNNKKQLKLKAEAEVIEAEVIVAEVIVAKVIVAEGTICSRTYRLVWMMLLRESMMIRTKIVMNAAIGVAVGGWMTREGIRRRIHVVKLSV